MDNTTDIQPANVEANKPTEIHLDDLHALSHAQLVARAASLGLRANPERTRHQLVFDLVKFYVQGGTRLRVDGILEMSGENQNHGFLRWPRYNFSPCPEDVYVPGWVVKKYFLRPGNRVAGWLRGLREKEKFMELDGVESIEGLPSDTWTEPKDFENLTPTFPTERIILENDSANSFSARAVDLITPLGRGQRALIVAPPRTGKTLFAQGHRERHPRELAREPRHSPARGRATGGGHRPATQC